MTTEQLKEAYNKVLACATVEIGIFYVWEDYSYTRSKDEKGNPVFTRVILLSFSDDVNDIPSAEEFDGTYEDFIACLDQHDVLAEDEEE
jgi:hypothetical protein